MHSFLLMLNDKDDQIPLGGCMFLSFRDGRVLVRFEVLGRILGLGSGILGSRF